MGLKKTFAVSGQVYEVEGVRADDPYFNSITEDFEIIFQKFCATFINKNSVSLDIGANIGVTSIILSHNMNNGVVYAIEPGKKIFSVLENNVKNNRINNIKTINCAISETTCKLHFIENSAYGHIKLNNGIVYADDGLTDAFSLDDLVNNLNIERLDFIKIDVEGFEHQVLKGGKETLRRFNPLIYLELNSWCLLDHSDSNPLEFARYLLENFEFVYRVDKTSGADTLLQRVDSARTLIHDNIVFNGSLDDLVVSNDPAKFQISINESYQRYDSVSAQLNNVLAERDSLSAQLNNVLTSKSWKLTQWLRSIRRVFI